MFCRRTQSPTKSVRLWLDDLRPARAGWTHARSVAEAQTLLATGNVALASLDHDLGACVDCERDAAGAGTAPPTICSHIPTGYDLCLWMAQTGHWPDAPPLVHSRNMVGAAQMRGLIAHHWRRPDARTGAMKALPNRRRLRTIMVVEDDHATRAMLALMLDGAGYHVAIAANGAEARAELRGVRPDLILLDLTMPALDGAGFCRQQLADPDQAHVPVWVLSGAVNAPSIARTVGAARCIEKPFDPDTLLEALKLHFQAVSVAEAVATPPL